MDMEQRAANKEVGRALAADRGGCVAALLFFAILGACLIGAFVNSPDDFDMAGNLKSGLQTPAQKRDALLGKLPGLDVTKPAPTTGATAPPVATTEPPVAETSPPQAGSAGGVAAPQQGPQQQAPAQPPPTDPPVVQPPACAFPGSLGVSGGSVGSLPGGGGSFTATSTSVVVSAGGLPICGQHYQLVVKTNHAGGGFNQITDCQLAGFNTAAPNVAVGDTIVVTFSLPPNSCG